MFKVLKPVRVSPIIKTTRWVLLICGIFHGTWKLRRYREIEKTQRVIREEKLRAEEEAHMRESKRRTVEELIGVARELDITEFPPDWEKDI